MCAVNYSNDIKIISLLKRIIIFDSSNYYIEKLIHIKYFTEK